MHVSFGCIYLYKIWGFSILCKFISVYLLSPEFWIYVYLYAHTFTHKHVTLCNICFCTLISAQMAQGCVGQDSHLCETAAGLVLGLRWPVCLSLECGGQIEQLCTAPALSVSVLHRVSPQSSSAGGRHRISLPFKESWVPLGTDPPRAAVRREDQSLLLSTWWQMANTC